MEMQLLLCKNCILSYLIWDTSHMKCILGSKQNQPTMKIQQLATVLIFFFCWQPLTAQQNQVISTIDTILNSTHFSGERHFLHRGKFNGTQPLNMKFKEGLKKLRDYIEKEENQFSGNVSFGFNSQESQRNNFFVISTGIDLSKDTYPSNRAVEVCVIFIRLEERPPMTPSFMIRQSFSPLSVLNSKRLLSDESKGPFE